MAQNLGIRKSESGSGDRPNMSIRASRDLNLVLCGSDVVLKTSLLKHFREEKTFSTSHRTELRSMSVMEAEMIDGRVIRLVELPAVSKLSKEEVMRLTLHCVSLCDPGVHVFLLVVLAGPLNDEDKAEIEKIQKIFDSREHFMVLFTTRFTVNRTVTNRIKSSPDSQRLIRLCGGQFRVMGLNEHENSRQITELLDYIENMKTEPYSAHMYVKAQENRGRRETEQKFKEMQKMEGKIREFQLGGAEGKAGDQGCLRIVLIGKTGNGKSATGNTILGREEFESDLSPDSVTTACKKGVGEVDGRSVAVVDTPGLFDTTLTNDLAVEEIVKCVSLSSPGPHVFVIVLSLGRFIQVESDTVDLIKKIFGHKSAQFSIVLFTGGDDLKNESIQDYVKRGNNAELKKLIRDCGNRFLVFNNNEKQDKTQVTQLLNMIEEVKNTNEGRYFTNSMFEEAEMSIKKRMEEILKEREREIQSQQEAIKAKYEKEIQELMKRLEKEKQRADKKIMEMMNQMEKDRKERDQQKREIEELQGEKSKIYLKQKTEEEIRKINMKFEDEARQKAEEINDFRDRENQWNSDLKHKLEEQEDIYESLEEQYEYLQVDKSEKDLLIKRKKRKRKHCVII